MDGFSEMGFGFVPGASAANHSKQIDFQNICYLLVLINHLCFDCLPHTHTLKHVLGLAENPFLRRAFKAVCERRKKVVNKSLNKLLHEIWSATKCCITFLFGHVMSKITNGVWPPVLAVSLILEQLAS